MNEIMSIQQSHRSIRSFKPDPVSDGVSWSNNLGNFYRQVYFTQIRPVAAMQGLNDK